VSDFLPFVLVGLTAGSVYGLAATGLVLTYKTSGIFNFAHGTIAALIAYAFYDLRERQDLPWPLALAICVLVLSPLIALVLERIARRLAEVPVAMKIVATVGLVVGLQQAIILRYGVSTIYTQPFLPTRTFRFLGVNVGADQLIVMAIALAGMLGLTLLFVATRSGRSMRAVVDQPDLLALTGASPTRVRRRAWYIGTAFAGLSGVLLAPTVGLDSLVLTLLIVSAFGAAAIGMFTSIPLSYVGGLVVGVLGALSTKYVAGIPLLGGVPPSLPFIVLFVMLVVAPGRWLIDFTIDRKPKVAESKRLPTAAWVIGGALLVFLMVRLPDMVGARLPAFTSALAFIIIFLSLALLMRTSGQVSLAQLAFAAVGAAASARLIVEAGMPWVPAVLVGALLAVPLGALVAIPAIRRSGLYLALATFGFAVLMEQMVFPTKLMFGGIAASLGASRPGFAAGDKAYFYVVLAFVALAIGLVTAVHRSRLGRLLRAMADSPTALTTYGTSVTAIKVIVFCVAAFLAGLGGALLGPVTRSASPGNFTSFASLLLLVILGVVLTIVRSEVGASIGAAVGLIVIPSYITSARLHDYFPLLFGVFAVLHALSEAEAQAPAWLTRAVANARRRAHRSPITARITSRPEVKVM
jgi:branched-subunit amino acid ABC-type transport system permease component